MRKLGPPSEIGRLAAPVARLLDGAWQRMHWWVATMAVLYAAFRDHHREARRSGGDPALGAPGGRHAGACRSTGRACSSPSRGPIDQVVRVQVKHVWEVPVEHALASTERRRQMTASTTLDPLTQGYALTGDQNIVHVDMVARYRVRDPAEWAFYGPKAEDVLRVEVTAAMVRSLGEMGVDRVLSDGRKNLIATATRRAQAGLDAAHSGLELSSLELTRLAPPPALASDFDAVQSAFIGAETQKKDAQAFAETRHPAGPGRGGRGGAVRARGRRDSRSRHGQGRCRGVSGARRGISGQPGGGSRAPLPGCRGTGHRRSRQRSLGAAAGRRQLPRLPHHDRRPRQPVRDPATTAAGRSDDDGEDDERR